MKTVILSLKITLASFILLQLPACSDKGKEIRQWLHEDTGSYAAAISNDNKFLLTGAIGGFGRVWDVQQNKVLYSVQHQDSDDGGIVAAAFSDNGRFLVTIEQQSIARWNMSDGRLVGYWSWPDLRDVAISASGRYALIGMKANQAIYFDMQEGKMRYVFPHHEKITSVHLSKDGRFALTGSDDWHASLWNLANGEHVWSKNMQYKISNVQLSDDGELAFANAYVGQARVYATDAKGSLVSQLDAPARGMTVVSADFSDDGRILASGRASKAIDIWDVKTGKRLKSWLPEVKQKVQPDSATILDLNISADKSQLLSESSTGIGQLWSLK
jgi:WD40 repeat protein